MNHQIKSTIAGLLLIGVISCTAKRPVEAEIPLSVEELRITKVDADLSGVSQQFNSNVQRLERVLKNANNFEQAQSIVHKNSNELWQAAVSYLQSNKNNNDDRALYWARLKFAKTIKVAQPNFFISSIQKEQLIQEMERASRGQSDINFSKNSHKRILITGFDPFFLDRNVGQSNPSGLAALLLDGKLIKHHGKTYEIQSAIFPVRFADFDQGEVERFLTPYYKNNSVDMIVTISMGREEFDLERFPGLRRSAKAPGNLNVFTGASQDNPLIPLLNNKPLVGDEFVEFSLPVKAMTSIQSPYKVNDNHSVTTLTQAFEPQSLGELEGETSVSGSGGGYLSNEISYRSINLRNKLNSKIPTGHLHTPRIQGFEPAVEKTIVEQIETIIIAGASSF